MKKHSSYPRNRNIANAFYKAGFVESWGRGFKKIAEEFTRAQMPMPVIEENGGGVLAIVQRKAARDVGVNVGVNVGLNVGLNVGDVSEMKPSDRQCVIISIIKSNPCVTVKQMSETLSVTSRTIERDLASMQKAGIVRHEGSDKTGIWVILEKDNV